MKLHMKAAAAAVIAAAVTLAADLSYSPAMTNAAQTDINDDEIIVYEEYVFYDGCTYILDPDSPDKLILQSIPSLSEPADITIPADIHGYSVTGIMPHTFDSGFVREVVLPDTVTYAGAAAFAGCGVTSVNIPKGLKIIPSKMFSGCTELKEVAFHDGIEVITADAFEGTAVVVPEELEGKVVDPNTPVLIDGWSCYKRINQSAPYISLYVNRYLGVDVDITMPISIGGYPVDGFSDKVFDEVRPTSVTIPECYSSIDVNKYNFKELTKLVIKAPRAELRGDMSGASVRSLCLPVDYYGDNSVYLPTMLKEVTFNGSGCLNIGNGCFSGMNYLSSIDIAESYDRIQLNSGSFRNVGIYNINVEAPCFISSYAFADCKNLRSAHFGSGAFINNGAFAGCDRLSSIVVDGTFEIVANSFRDCPYLENITFDMDQDVNFLGFQGCRSLYSLNSIPAFNSRTCDFTSVYKDYIMENFNGIEDVGFINQYVAGKVKAVVQEVVDPEMNDMQKVRALHDWVCDNTKYADDDVRLMKYHSDASVFMNDSTVCDGYSKICNLLFHEAGIETYCVSGYDHTWNIVNVGGNYFHIDCTWDDLNGSYDWFLRSDDQLIGTDKNHCFVNTFELSSLHSFQGSTIPKCSYSMGDVNRDGSVGISDLVSLTRFILGSGVPSAEAAVLCDVNFDGSVDVYDTVNMRRLIIS